MPANFLNVFLLLFLILEKGSERRNIDLLSHLFMHSFMSSDWNGTQNFGVLGQCSNQHSYPARASNFFF